MRRRFMYSNGIYNAGAVAFVAPAGARIAQVSLDNLPHGVYRVVTAVGFSGATVFADFTNFELQKNGGRLWGLAAFITGPTAGLPLILDPRDIISVNVGAIAGSAAANYVASVSLELVQELSTDPGEEPDLAAILANQQERIGSSLDKIVTCLDALKARLGT